MLSKQEQFAKKTVERLYAFADPDYELYDTYGRHAKPDILSVATLSKKTCGKDNGYFLAILNLIEKYCSCDSAKTETLRAEEELLKAIVKMEDEFVIKAKNHLDVLQEKSRSIFSNISDEDKKDVDVRKNDLKYVIAQSDAKSVLDVTACFKMYFDGLMYGLLSAEPLPDSESDAGAGFEAGEVPIFVHEPISQDIPADKTEPFFGGLRTLAETDALFIKSMMRDCDNGNVFVRLFDPDNGFTEEYIEIEKADAYYKWIIKEDGYCNWPGYIIAALEDKGLSIDADPKDLFGCILGSRIDETDISDFCAFSKERIVIPGNTPETKIWAGYKNCGLMLYASLLVTNSNMIEDAEQYLNLREALEEFISCFSLTGAGKETRNAAMNLLKQYSDDFKKQAVPVGRRMRKRILVCDVIDTMFELYFNQPDVDPYKIIHEQYPQLLK